MLRTPLTQMLGIKHPIIQAGMGPYSTNNLAIAVANAGALGIISAIGMAAGIASMVVPSEAQQVFGKGKPSEIMKRTIEQVRDGTRQTKGIFGVNCPVSQEFLPAARELIGAALEMRKEDEEVYQRMRAIITSAGNPKPWAHPIKSTDAIWIHVVPSVYHARKAQEAGVDIIVASGHEGGAHVAWDPVHTMVLLPAVVEAVDRPVVGAGGFCDGKTLAAALALGAVGIQMGTRFIATKESDFNPMWKQKILELDERGTFYARGLFGPMRFLKGDASMKIGEATVKHIPRLYLGEPQPLVQEIAKYELEGFAGLLRNDPQRAVMLGGEVVGRIRDIPSVGELIQRIVNEAEMILKELPQKYILS